ncbi:F-box/kelch-repeat protein At5g15710-like [Curcuma longa]|uniref:F-box/kelch-repeat protein At5g15710-like n=1 Tax=Curcuma longa TaxID=136217 RepID=UPI003D9F4B3F
MGLWELLPLDLLARVFSFLPPDSVARAMAACKHWLACARSRAAAPRHAPWLIVLPVRGGPACFAHDPALDRWHALPLDFLPCPLRLVAPVGRSLLCRLAAASDLRLVLLNPFTRQFRHLPDLAARRRNPAVGVIDSSPFSVIVAGGASGSGYEPTVERYEAGGVDRWEALGPMPVEFAVRLTVWTPNESVHAGDGAMYWMTSARAYSVMGFDLRRRTWREVKAPMADLLEWAALVRRPNRKLGLVGGAVGGQGTVWELTDKDDWAAVAEVPAKLGQRIWGCRKAAAAAVGGAVRCVGGEKTVYLFKDIGSEMLVWEEEGGWRLMEGRRRVSSTPIKAALLHPTLSVAAIFHASV